MQSALIYGLVLLGGLTLHWGYPEIPPALLMVGLAASLGVISFLLDAQLLGRMRSLSSVTRGLSGWRGEVLARAQRVLRKLERERDEDAARTERFTRAIAASPNGVALLDAQGRIEWCNQRMADHFGLDAERDRGQHLTHLVRHPGLRQAMLAEQFSEPVLLEDLQKADRFLELQLVPFGSDGKLLLSRDVSREMLSKKMQREFVANVSHELKTPLTVFVGFIETLKDGELEAEDRERIFALMSEQSGRMQQLVQDLLLLAELDSGRLASKRERLEVSELLQTMYQHALSLSKGKHKIELEGAALKAQLKGSRREVESALLNFVSNAVRYTPASGIIKLRALREGAGLRIEVADSGCGIAPEHLPRLTERFYRVDRARSLATGGTGLGLAIAKHALARNGARHEIKSELGVGSAFSAVFEAAEFS
jgi:two-component system, OmpR family, phosphate regulon sensor histidine kinase PhoR